MTESNFELRIYGVQFYFEDEDNEDTELDNYEIEGICDEDFINRAEEEGNVFTLNKFLREQEANNYGGASDVDFYNMTLRAYLVDVNNPSHVLRIDHSDFLLSVNQIKHVSEVI